MTKSELTSLIDHTLLKPEATRHSIEKLCQEAIHLHCGAVCIHPCWIKNAKFFLKGTSVKIVTVVGFPLGATFPEAKAKEASLASEAGADEIDMVLSIGAALEGRWSEITQEIYAVVSASGIRPVKVILETAYLTKEQIQQACLCSIDGGAQFVKTSTGFGPAGASIEAVQIMRQTVGSEFGVKASGGIRDWATAQAMLEAGANRLGTSQSVSIIQEANLSHQRTL